MGLCPCMSLLCCCGHWATAGGSLPLTVGADPHRAVLRDPSSRRSPDRLALDHLLLSQTRSSKPRLGSSPPVLPRRTELRPLWGWSGKVPGDLVWQVEARIPPRKQVPELCPTLGMQSAFG